MFIAEYPFDRKIFKRIPVYISMKRKLSDEHKRKISESMRGDKNHFYGKKHSNKSKNLMSQTTKKQVAAGIINVFKKGRIVSEESKKKQAITRSKFYSGANSPRWAGGKNRYWQKKARDLMIKKGFNVEGFHVHHINQNVKDCRLDNLKLLTPEDHGRLHGRGH